MNAYILDTIKEKYPNMNSIELANELNISIYQLRRIVSKYFLSKSDSYKNILHNTLMHNKEIAYNSKIVQYVPTQIQENILIGSLLGDGSLACYGRSKASYYREHGCKEQSNYRAWKAEMLASLDFKYFGHYESPEIKSPSNPLYSHYHQLFYLEGQKQITPLILTKLTHPIGLMCLYLDDGSLVIDRYIRKNKVHLFPRITIYSQSFTKDENELLKTHILKNFGIRFIIKKRPDGNGVVLQCNYREDIIKFLHLIHLEHPLLECMHYKLNLIKVITDKKHHYQKMYPNHEIIIDRYTLE